MSTPIIHVVDDDPSFRTAVTRLLRAAKYEVRSYASASEFLDSSPCAVPGCILLDLQMPGLSGLDLQQRLFKAGAQIPIIFITGHGDIPMTVQAMKAGAVEFLTKPFREQELLDAIRRAIDADRAACMRRAALADLGRQYESLTPREREVMRLVVRGMPNKLIASELGTTEKTVKVHRGHIMQKMAAKSLAELVLISERLRG